MKHLFSIFLIIELLLLSACSSNKQASSRNSSELIIAFGSCNHQWEERQPIWKEVVKNSPDLWIWLGDIVYADTDDMPKMKDDYETQKANVDYNYLKSRSKVIGIWDDHDYGLNDAGKEYSKKDSSKMLLFDFLEIPKGDTAYTHKGVYQSHSYTRNSLKVKVILLDVRYFRDPLEKKGGTILGDEQWRWLISELQGSNADVHIIGGGIQFLAKEHQYEKWANFPGERARLIQLLDILEVKNPILLSGDRHLGEMALQKLPVSGKPLLEITSSGLTHSYTDFKGEENSLRIGPVVSTKNFGILRLEKRGRLVFFDAELRNDINKVQYSVSKGELSKLLVKIKDKE